MRKAVQLGIAKVNIDTRVRVAFYDSIIETVHEVEQGFAEADRSGKMRKYDIRKLLARRAGP